MDGVSLLEKWGNFYVIVGSSSAALTGLMFVAVTVMPTTRRRVPGMNLGILSFNSPTVVHLCTGVLVAALLSMPWTSLREAAWALGLCGVAGIIYGVVVYRRMLRMERETPYRPVFEDWLWHIIVPNLAYAVIGVGGVLLARDTELSLFAVGAATLVLLFACIHNAWDIVTYIAIQGFPDEERPPA